MREKRWWQWYWMPTAILLIGMISFSLLVWVNHINERQRINSLFVETLMDIQIHTATAHLWLEQAVSGDKDVDVDGQILAGMEQSINLANVLLNGGRAEHGLISVPMKEPDKQAQTKAIISLLQDFKSLALMRLRDPGSHGIGSPADRQIDEVFKKILGKTGRLEDIIENNKKSDLEKSQRLYLGILAAWMFIVIVAAGGGWSRERRRKSAEEALLKANVQLRSQAEELTEHRERLSKLVDVRTAELTNANELLLVENVQRRRMEEELAKKARLASLRAEIGGALGQNQVLRHTLQRCAELMVQYLDVAFFRIWTLNETEQVLEMQASAGMYTHIDGPHGRVPVGMFKIGMIASERQPHLTNDVLSDPRIGDREWARREGMIVFAGYPLIVADRLVGVMATFARTTLNEEILGELGSVASLIAQCIERKLAEEEVKFKNIIHSTQQECTIDGILMVDDNAAVISYNRRFVEMWGIPPELPTIGDDAPLLQFVANMPMDPEGFLARVSYLYEHREEKSHEEIALKDGKVFDRYSAPMTGSDGKYYGRVWYFSDITERKQMEEKLRKARDMAEESTQRLELVLEGSNDATWELDMITGQCVLNSRFYEMMEFTPRDESSDFAFIMNAIHPDDVDDVQRRMQEHLEGKTGNYEASFRLTTKSGKLKNVMGRGKVVRYDEDGRPTRVAGVTTDVTKMKRLSDEVNRIHNLESIGILSGGLAHDFNNVLNIIYGNITFARMLADGNTAIVEPLTDAEEACERAKGLGIRLQAFSQGSSPARESIALPAVIEDAAGTLYKDSNILHSISAADDLFPVEADPRQIRQVFENLLANAKEAMSDGGTVTVRIENTIVNGKKELPLGSGNYVCITLQDDGRGIPEENLSKIFDPYFSTKDTYSQRGMGLGLSICHAILNKHRGHISVDSKLEVGTRVRIYLPASLDETKLAPKGLS